MEQSERSYIFVKKIVSIFLCSVFFVVVFCMNEKILLLSLREPVRCDSMRLFIVINLLLSI